RVRLAFGISHNQIAIDLFHLLSYQSKLPGALRIQLVFVAEGNRFECEDRFACRAHWFDLLFITLGGRCRAELTTRVDNNRCACYSRASYPAIKIHIWSASPMRRTLFSPSKIPVTNVYIEGIGGERFLPAE